MINIFVSEVIIYMENNARLIGKVFWSEVRFEICNFQVSWNKIIQLPESNVTSD